MSRFEGMFTSDIPFGSQQNACATGVLHVTSSIDDDLPIQHYWVLDRTVLPAVEKVFHAQNYDDLHFTPFQDKAAW